MRSQSMALAAAIAASASLAYAIESQTAPSGVRWVTGGVGADERAVLERTADQYNLKLVFAAKKNTAYAADVHFTVRGANGEVALEGDADGPWVLADLPAGTYDVEASSRGERQTQEATVNDAAKQVVFYFAR